MRHSTWATPLIALASIMTVASIAHGQPASFGGLYFPEGAVSFADQVIVYNPLASGGPAPTSTTHLDPLDALGVPDASGSSSGSVSLGNGGLVELLFTDNILSNSGNANPDIHVFEVGPDVEDTFIAIRPADTATASVMTSIGTDANGDGYYEVGKVFGSISSIDIDALFPSYPPGQLRFDAIQIMDDPSEGNSTGDTVGSDIDAVGVIDGPLNQGTVYRGAHFPQGDTSFADLVLTYDPLFGGGPGPTAANATDPIRALGPPDYGTATGGYVSLGRGGLIELLFVDNALTNSGDDLGDLFVFEIGAQVEDTFVAIRPADPATLAIVAMVGVDSNSDGYFEVGKVTGATSTIDIDSFFPGYAPGALGFDAVQLVDDPNEGGSSGQTVGADIDAVGAISSVCSGYFLEYGTACLTGQGQSPKLSGSGCPAPGSPITITLTDAPPGATAILFLGGGTGSAPAVPSCSLDILPLFPVSLPLPVPGSGSFSLPAWLPPVLATPFDVYLQFLIDDPTAAGGVAGSQALRMHIE